MSDENDGINALLPEEFHTKNGIPTDPDTHSLFYVSRTKAVLVYWLALGAGIAVCYGFSHPSFPLIVLGVIAGIVPAYLVL
jgi:hypothetical protein